MGPLFPLVIIDIAMVCDMSVKGGFFFTTKTMQMLKKIAFQWVLMIPIFCARSVLLQLGHVLV